MSEQLQQTHDLFKSMTPREIQIIKLLAEGNSTKEVSNILGIRQTTVEAHRYNIMKKSKAKNTAQIVGMFIRGGVI